MIQAKFSAEQISQPTSINAHKPLSKSSEFPFIDLIRFLSMMGIVWAHTEFEPPDLNFTDYLKNLGHVEYYILFKQVFKFGVLSFFMISGILFGDQLDRTTPLAYFKRRIDSTLKPYLVASGLFVGILVFIRYILNKGYFNSWGEIIQFTYFKSTFWYLPNYLICLAVLLLFWNYLKSLYFGMTLLFINITYTLLTVYDSDLITSHTSFTAVFSYLFYLWLGAYISNKGLVSKIKKINPFMLFAAVVVLYLVSCLESYQLFQKQMGYFNILRFGNQAYSLAMFVFLIRICNKRPNFWKLNPRKESFGIYLYHGFFANLIFPKLFRWTSENWHIDWYQGPMGFYLLVVLFNFTITYLLTLLLVKYLIRFKIAYL